MSALIAILAALQAIDIVGAHIATVTSVHGGTVASVPAAVPTGVPLPTPSFPAVGSIPRDYSPAGLESLWNLVGPVETPPITTTVEPTLPDVLPSPPPALYPSWFAPEPANIMPNLTLPAGFLFGVSSAAYQVEGAAKEDGKGPSAWDWAPRQPGGTIDNSTGDITDLQYYLYKVDVARMASLGINAHSFSISWARIYPFGAADSPVNQAGLQHYSDMIDYHLQMGVKPVVTLFHWDTPLALLAYYGGFTSSQIIDDFVNYAKTVFAAYKGRVTTWYTFNEPRVFCSGIASYPFEVAFAPGVNASTAPYICSYNLVKAHVAAVKAFRAMGMPGEIAYKNDDFIGTPWRADSSDDQAAVERHTAFQLGAFSEPVYGSGDWPQILLDTLPPSFLPRFTPEEVAENRGTADFYAIDAYRAQYVAAPAGGLAACVNNMTDPNWPQCNEVVMYDTDGWAVGPTADTWSASWLQATPQNLRGSLRALVGRWPVGKIYISEFGFNEPGEARRSNSLLTPWDGYIVTEDVTRTTFIDDAEWTVGFAARFGIQYLNQTTGVVMVSEAQFFAAHLQKNATVSP